MIQQLTPPQLAELMKMLSMLQQRPEPQNNQPMSRFFVPPILPPPARPASPRANTI